MAISIRWAISAIDIASATIERSIKKPAPTRPSLLSRRTKFTVAITARARIKIVHATALCCYGQRNQDRDLMNLRHLSAEVPVARHS